MSFIVSSFNELLDLALLSIPQSSYDKSKGELIYHILDLAKVI
jgi:hypothetical protein